MADKDTSSEQRNEQPTEKRLRDARGRGQIPRSRELGMAAVMLAGAASLLLLRPWYAEGIGALLAEGLVLDGAPWRDDELMLAAFEDSVVTGLRLLAPLFLAVSVGAVAGALSFGGWTFSLEALAPKLDKLDPLAGLKRVFGWSGLTELVKAVAKFVVVALCAGLVLSSMAADFLGLGRLPIQEALPRAAYLCALSFLGFSAVLLVIAACDVPMQWWQYQRRLRMSRQELRDELKETEGKPEVRSRIRSIQQELATRRMMDAVPKADVVATNPTHYAVALRYDARRMRAPRVVAKGADLIALNIRNVARAHGVPLFEHPVLARALYATTDIGKEIPPRLYMAVAQVLTYVYQLRDRRSRRTPRRPAIRIDADVVPGHAPPRAEA